MKFPTLYNPEHDIALLMQQRSHHTCIVVMIDHGSQLSNIFKRFLAQLTAIILFDKHGFKFFVRDAILSFAGIACDLIAVVRSPSGVIG